MQLRVRIVAALVAVLALPLLASAQTVVWTLIDVKARLDNDGRLHVVETHHLTLTEGGGLNITHEFGLGVDQSIVFRGITRLGPGKEEQALEDADVGPADRYRYYPLGHVYFSIPEYERGTTVAYRMEYELVNALSPAWAIAAGKGPLARPTSLDPPRDRLREVMADLREDWPPRDRVYRLDHDVLFPNRGGPGFVFERIDYQLAFDSTWKMVSPEAELGQAQSGHDYRVRPLFERIVEEIPVGVDRRSPRIRWMAVAALVGFVPVLWLLLMLTEGVGNRLLGGVTFESMNARLSTLAPESMAAILGGSGTEPTLESILSRMAGEKKIGIEIEPGTRPATSLKAGPDALLGEGDDEEDDDEDDELPPLVRIRRIAPLESLPPLERDLLSQLLVGGRRDVTSADLQTLYAERGFEPWEAVKIVLPPRAPRPKSFLGGLLGLASLGGGALQITSLANLDPIPIVILADILCIGFLHVWPRAYWHGGSSKLAAVALLLPGFIASAGGVALLLSLNPPLAAKGFVGTAALVLAAYGGLLARARRPWRGEPHATVRELARIRSHADRELRRPRPRLDDRYIAQLEVMGLGPRLEAWRSAGGGMAGGDLSNLQDEPSDGSAAPARPFTGRASVPFKGPHKWTDALWVVSAEERREMADED